MSDQLVLTLIVLILSYLLSATWYTEEPFSGMYDKQPSASILESQSDWRSRKGVWMAKQT